jgi:hypothetical protein
MTTYWPSAATGGDDERLAGEAFVGDANVTTNAPSPASALCPPSRSSSS